ncbi:DUF1446 domain-containing protein [Asaia siamensis]
MKKIVKIAAGAGFSSDRILPAQDLAERADIHYLVFECLAERTIALAQREKQSHPELGYNEWLEDRMLACLAPCHRRGITIITNMGAANPQAAGAKIAEVARRLGLRGLKIAVVTGDDVLDACKAVDYPLMERNATLSSLGETIVSANAYTGSEAVVAALRMGADVIVTGRIADPSLFLAPLIHEFGWDPEDWDLIGKGIHMGHLLECSAHATGGYFADPGFKDVPDPARIGFPIAEVEADGSFIVIKLPGSGGMVTPRTLKEQTLYEVHDPAHYPTADCVADFSQVQFEQIAADRVRVTGAQGHPRPECLKVSVGYVDSYIGEGQIGYCGPNALARAQLALEMVRQRLIDAGVETTEDRFELIGVNAVRRGVRIAPVSEPDEVLIRVACRTANMRMARRVGHEVEALWLNGPAGGGGARRSANEVLAIVSVLIPRELVRTVVDYLES